MRFMNPLTTEYCSLASVDSGALIALVNNKKVREHLIEHPLFTPASLQAWITEKQAIDSTPGCCVRAILVDKQLAGWCAIQPYEQDVELAVVLHPDFWGVGKRVYAEMLITAQKYGHTAVWLHLLDTRPVYRFLLKKAIKVDTRQLLGRQFTSYLVSTR